MPLLFSLQELQGKGDGELWGWDGGGGGGGPGALFIVSRPTRRSRERRINVFFCIR